MDKTGRFTKMEISLQILLGILLWIFLLFPIVIFVSIPLAILHWGHHLAARIFRKDLIPVNNPVDHVVILKPTRENPMGNCCQVWKLKGKLNLNEFRKHFQKLFLSTPELRESYRNLYCYFEQWGLYIFKKPVEMESLNLDKMIQEMHWDYENQEKDMEDEEALDGFIGKWMSTADYGRSPCWRILIIQLDKTGESVMLFRIDHGLMDGYSMVHMVDRLSGNKAPYVVKEHDFSFATKMRYIITCPWLLLERSISHSWLKRIPLPDYTPEVKFPEDAKWMVSFTSLDLKAVKKVRQLTKSHFNTVLGALQIGALRKYCLERQKEENLPENVFLTSPSGWPNHPAMTRGIIGNHLSVTGVDIPFKDPDPLKRLLKAEESYLQAVDAGVEIFYRWIVVNLCWAAFPSLLSWMFNSLNKRGAFPGRQCLSPLMLSSEEHKLLGIPVEHLYLPVHVPLLIRAAHLMIVPAGNSGRLDIGVNGTNKIFKNQKDLDRFTKVYLKEELDSLVNALNSGKY